MQFRLAYLSAARDRNVVQQVAQAAKWQARPGPNPANGANQVVVKGRGIAYQQRSGTVNAVVAEVEVNRKTGAVKVTKFTAGQDAGLVVNPGTATGTIEANLMQAMGRAMHESVAFDANGVKSVDWDTYPIASIKDTPEMNVLLDQREGHRRRRQVRQPERRRRAVDAPDGGGDRERDLRRDGRAGAARSR